MPRSPPCRADLHALSRGLPATEQLLAETLAARRDLFPSPVTVIRLTDREQRVLEQLARGRTIQQTADELVVSYNTVKTQQRSLYRKLDANTRIAAIARARHVGLLQDLPDGQPSAADDASTERSA
ncbi:MAG TPA: helix-turn-helix transcriptional regulator [Jatrophihabitans sp.]|nr:helix-turn-helix transcriptional regulator [Jatrophihabitans sp.]